MNRDYLKQVIIDQKEVYLENSIVRRDLVLEENINYCFVGIRRTGKSYMMYQQVKNLLEAGTSIEEILYVNFEDERLLEVMADDLNTILEIGLEMAGEGKKPYVFLDEIQNVDGWEKFVRRLADMKYRVNITGSNSKMLSHEIASTLGGRFMIVYVMPYSFGEYLHAHGKNKDYLNVLSTSERAGVNKMYEQYVTYGAFPELVNVNNKRQYLSSIYQTIYIGDILTRNNITNDFAVRLILKKIAESVMKPISFSRLTNILKSAGTGIGKQTVINYVGYMLDAYLLFSIQNYAAKLVDKETSPKYYFMDTGLLGLLVMNSETAQLENLVAIELVRRYGIENVYYFERNVEIDFYIPEEELAIQVSYSILSDVSTKERELGAFDKLRNHMPDTKCLLITNSEETEIEYNGINVTVMPVWKWLLQR
ncbi:MAG: ATP-binding protein [Lachnospiraceae bacterium]|nr:ATP-binding protein [Lachnospiraceae bacterium]